VLTVTGPLKLMVSVTTAAFAEVESRPATNAVSTKWSHLSMD
jgi:hypothetical protein